MKYSTAWLITLCLLLTNSADAQGNASPDPDSLKGIINSGKVNNTNLIVFRHLATLYLQKGQYDSALIIYRQAITKSNILKNSYWSVKYNLWLGGVYTVTTKYDSAKKYLELSYPLIQKIDNDSLLAQYYQNTGTLYQFQNINDKAAEYLLRSIEILEKMGDKRPLNLLTQAYSNMSGIFNNDNQPGKALAYDKKAIASKTDMQNPADYAALYFNASVTYKKVNDNNNFKLYLDSALYFNKQYENSRALLNILGGYGTYYESQKLYDSALVFYQQAMDMSKETEDMYFFAEQAINAAAILLKQNKPLPAKQLLNEATPLAKEFGDYTMLAGIYNVQKEIAKKTGNYKDAIFFAELNKAYSDSATNEATQQITISLETKYESQKKEKEIADLTISNTQKQLTVVKRNRLLIIGGISAASLLLILGLLYRNSRHRQTIAEKEKVLQQEQIKFLNEQQQVVSLQSMINGQETERTRIAKDLHDGLGGLFSTVKMHLSTLQHDVQGLKENQLFSKSFELVDSASVEVRRIAHNMMPEVLMKLGLADGLKDMCNNISSGKLLKVTFQAYGMEKRLNASTEIMLYRIIQELLNNIIKHSQATEALVQFNRDGDRLHITVEDNGRGFNTMEADGNNHAGLETVQSRVDYLNGKLSIESQQGLGTTIMMEFLINEK